MIEAGGNKLLDKFRYVHAMGHPRQWMQKEVKTLEGEAPLKKTSQLSEAKAFMEAMGPGPLHLHCLHA